MAEIQSPEHPPGSASSSAPDSDEAGASPPRPPAPVAILHPSSERRRRSRSTKVFRAFRHAFRSFPILTPTCRFPTISPAGGARDGHIHGAVRMTGTLFGHRRARINLAVQENPRSLPLVLLELAVPTAKLLNEMGAGMVRIALECEKKAAAANKTKLLDEPLWTMFCNGRKTGYGTRRDPTDADLNVMQLLHAVSMGAGVLPCEPADPADGELTYMRAHFDRVTGSRDSETFYMLNPDGNAGPELSIFFIRI